MHYVSSRNGGRPWLVAPLESLSAPESDTSSGADARTSPFMARPFGLQEADGHSRVFGVAIDAAGPRLAGIRQPPACAPDRCSAPAWTAEAHTGSTCEARALKHLDPP